jgi:SAM-dependent methyltransferase
MKRCLGCEEAFEAPSWTCPSCGFAPPQEEGVPVFAPALRQGAEDDADYRHQDLAAAEARHFWFRHRRRAVSWALGHYFPADRRFLDVGCGTGYMAEAVLRDHPGLSVTAVDASLPFLRHVTARLSGHEVLQVDARRLPFRDEFDVAGAFDVIEHLDEDEAVLAEMRRALRPGGGLLVTVPQHPWLWSTVDDFSRHRRRYTRRELVARTERAGFAVLRVTSLFALTLPMQAAARLRRVPAERFDPVSELRIGGAANAVLAAAMRLEERAVRWGVPLPAGGSLLLVARKA